LILSEKNFILGRPGLGKLKIKSFSSAGPAGAREHRRAELEASRNEPMEPNWSKRILLQAARALESSK
jgi:hypothetical protein